MIYIVEDDPITSMITELLVSQHESVGEVQKYMNGQEAFNKLQLVSQQASDIPDLILLDLNMPIMDGWEFLDAFSNLVLTKQVCVCVLTSSIDPDDIEKSKLYKEVKGYFTKPIEVEMVDEMLGLVAEC
ncbi:MAG TPA: response regulator [Hymenobacter sp.]